MYLFGIVISIIIIIISIIIIIENERISFKIQFKLKDSLWNAIQMKGYHLCTKRDIIVK